MFWMAQALAENDIEVDVVTNAQEVEPEFRLFNLGAWEPALDLASEPRPRSGHVTVHSTTPDVGSSFIPWAKPFVTKLAARVADVVSANSSSLIHSSYWEPYGLSAHLASDWTGTPFGLQHAGSDVGRLYCSKQLRGTYERMLAAADYQILSAQTSELTQSLGLDAARLYPLAAALPPSVYFSPRTAPLDVPLALRAVRYYFAKQSPLGTTYAQFAQHEYDCKLPTVGVFGKLSRGKGLVDLMAALGDLKRRGVRFNFVVMGQARRDDLSDFLAWLDAFEIREATFLLPFLPPWQVPHFIRACDLVCVLEKHFPIPFHTPMMAMEVVACGTPLLMSDEIAAKQLFAAKLSNGHNAFVVDPADRAALVKALAEILADRRQAVAVGARGERELAIRDLTGSYGSKVATRFLQIARECSERRALQQRARHMVVFEREAQRAQMGSDVVGAARDGLVADYRRERLPYLFEFVRGQLSMTHRVLRQALHDHFTDFYLDSTVPHDSDARTALLKFGDYLQDALRDAEAAPDYATDVLCFELQRFTLKGQRRAPPRRQREPSLPPDCRPVASRGLVLQESDYDLPRLFERLRETAEEDDLPAAKAFRSASRCCVFKRVHQQELDPEILAVSHGSRAILTVCDGTKTVADVVRAVRAAFPFETEAAVLRGLEQLWQVGCLEEPSTRPTLSDLKVVEARATELKRDPTVQPVWRAMGLCANAYPKRVVQLLMTRNVDRAHFKLNEEAGAFVLHYMPLHADYGEGDILDELNYLCLAETQREIAEPVRQMIVSGLVRKFSGEGRRE
jgi:glycosyltransferase involved in cell wall biosynthesis